MENAEFFNFRALVVYLRNIGFDNDDIVTFFLKSKEFDLENGSLSMLYKIIEIIPPGIELAI